MRVAQIQYRDQKSIDYIRSFKLLSEEQKIEHKLIHSIQTAAWKINHYTNQPTQYWKEGGKEAHYDNLQKLIEEYESKYGKYELKTI